MTLSAVYPLIEMRGISKHFGAVRALENVDLRLQEKEILGLVGDNAAGKTTLMKILTAVHKPDRGIILVNGQPVRIGNPLEARNLGIEMIYQDFSLVPNLSITDNIFLGREETRRLLGIPFLNRDKMRQISREALAKTDIHMNSVDALADELSGGQQQAVAISRAAAFNSKIIVMDEPTASLSIKAIPPVLQLMYRLRESGKSIIFITHRIQDIFSTCDRIMVLRRGACVGVARKEDTSIQEVTELITGAKETFSAPSE